MKQLLKWPALYATLILLVAGCGGGPAPAITPSPTVASTVAPPAPTVARGAGLPT